MIRGNINNVLFNERGHTCWYEGRRLYRVTGAIQTILGKTFPKGVATIEVALSYSSQVHREVENWINSGCYSI